MAYLLLVRMFNFKAVLKGCLKGFLEEDTLYLFGDCLISRLLLKAF